MKVQKKAQSLVIIPTINGLIIEERRPSGSMAARQHVFNEMEAANKFIADHFLKPREEDYS